MVYFEKRVRMWEDKLGKRFMESFGRGGGVEIVGRV
jgi:hypothetical protein